MEKKGLKKKEREKQRQDVCPCFQRRSHVNLKPQRF